jgi:hypothetical protein
VLWCVAGAIWVFWLHASLSGDGARLSLCTEKQLKLDTLVATNRTVIVATIEFFWNRVLLSRQRILQLSRQLIRLWTG